MNAAVWYPCFFSKLAQVACRGESGIPKSVTPCTLGNNPVRMVVCEVLVIGLWV